MIWLGILLPICYVPGITGALVPTQWLVLSAVLPLTLWREGNPGLSHLFWVIFIGFALLGLLWTPSVPSSIYALWIAAIWALSFWLGSTLSTLVPLWKGLAIGMSISSAVAIAQAIGYHPVGSYDGAAPAGLLYNPTVSGAAAALIIIALIIHRLWVYIPGVVPGLVLAQSRGAWIVLSLALIWQQWRWRGVIPIALVVAAAFALHPGDSERQRFAIWHLAWVNLSWFGEGPGMFSNLWFQFLGRIEKPGFAHNDYLQIWFEYGIGALPLFAVYATALNEVRGKDWPIFAAFACLGTFYFPLWCPLLAFIGMLVAGHLSCGRDRLRAVDAIGRSDDAPWWVD